MAPERPAPARFAAASIGVDLPVVRTGVSDDGLMQLPETNREVAWYRYGSRPGDPAGTTVLAAHVDTRTEGLGPFARLRQLRRGAGLAVTDATGRTRRYTVTSVADVPKSRIPLDQLFRTDGPPGLTVLTCGGPFSQQTGYRDNIVVTAQPTR
ncbi:class F sortase [uncultured Friedmanniella sp.]|uniref:class F sortase n=1 Tax=uncultured Friedmanniella sp. TaxID=335381 RepID=UPI0035CA7493